MSQLATFSRQVDSLKTAIEKALAENVDTKNSTVLAGHYSVLQKLQAQIDTDLYPTCEKIRQKLGQIDPVTGAKRYGAQAEQKFNTSAEILSTITSLLLAHIQQHEEQYLSAKHYVEEAKEQLERAKASALPTPIMSKITVERFDQENTDDLMLATGAADDELHRKAEEVRLKKQLELDELRLFEKKLDLFLKDSFAGELNEKMHLLEVADVVHDLKSSSTFSVSDWRTMRNLLVDILRRIVSKPDDINLRKIKATHPAIQSKITGKIGGVPLLLALGFKAVVKREHISSLDSSSSTSLSPDDLIHHPLRAQWLKQHRAQWESSFFSTNTGNDSSSNASCWTFDHLSSTQQLVTQEYHQVFVLCNNPPTSPWELLFEMEEPPIDDLLASSSANSDGNIGSISSSDPPLKRPRVILTWIDWYDRLQASINTLEQS